MWEQVDPPNHPPASGVLIVAKAFRRLFWGLHYQACLMIDHAG